MNDIIKLISDEIIDTTNRLNSERENPHYGADASDYKIKQLTERQKTLRRIREELEDLPVG